jgi:hypothetical protein
MSKDVFKNVGAKYINGNTQTYQISFMMEGSDIPANFNPMEFFQNAQSGGNSSVVHHTSGGKTVTIKGSGNMTNGMHLDTIMEMFGNQVDSDVQFRMGELTEICQNSTKVGNRKLAADSKKAQKPLEVIRVT